MLRTPSQYKRVTLEDIVFESLQTFINTCLVKQRCVQLERAKTDQINSELIAL